MTVTEPETIVGYINVDGSGEDNWAARVTTETWVQIQDPNPYLVYLERHKGQERRWVDGRLWVRVS